MLRGMVVALAVISVVGCGGNGMKGVMGLFRVVDAETGAPIAGAELFIVTSNKPLAPPAKTDAEGNGRYDFEWAKPVPEDQIRYQVKAPGYETLDVHEDYLTLSSFAEVDGAPAAYLELTKSP